MGPGEGIRDILAKSRQKRALVIKDAYIEPLAVNFATTSATYNTQLYLKLSQEPGLVPGLLLPLAFVHTEIDQATAAAFSNPDLLIKDLFHAWGSLWAPRYVGVRIAHSSSPISFDFDVHLDYDVVEVDWQDWFMMWDFLDNVVDNERQY